MSGLSLSIGLGLCVNVGGVGIPAGYRLTRFNGQQVYWSAGVLNITSGRPVFDNGVSLYVAG